MSLRDVYEQSISKMAKGGFLPTIGNSFSAGDVHAWIPSGIVPLDAALGGGLPLGRYSELFSRAPSDGKSTLAITFAIQVQKAKGNVLWLESEAALDKARAIRMGLDPDRMIIHAPETLEDGFDYLRQVMRLVREDEATRPYPFLVVWDTIAAAPIAADRERDEQVLAGKDASDYSQGITKKPRILADNCRKLTIDLFKNSTHVLFVNQTYQSLSRYGPKQDTPGGNALKFHASLRLELFRSDFIEENDEKVGIEVTFETKKNKLALPFRSGTLVLYGETGYSNPLSVARTLEEKKKIQTAKGGYYVLQTSAGPKNCRFKQLPDRLAEHPEVLKAWTDMIYQDMWKLPGGRHLDPASGWVLADMDVEPPETQEPQEESEDSVDSPFDSLIKGS